MSDARVKVGADLSEFRHEFALATQFADERVKQLSKSAKKDLTSSSTGAATLGKQISTLIGGRAAEAAEALQIAGSAAGSFGLAAGAAAVAGVALAAGVYEIGEAALAAEERLRAQGLAALLDPAAAQSVEDYRAAQASLRAEVDLTTVELSGPFTQALTDVSHALTGTVDVVGRLFKRTEDLRGVIASVGKNSAVAALGTTSLGAAAVLLGKAFGIAADRGEQLEEIQQDTAEGQKVAEEWAKRSGKAFDERAAAEERLADAARKRDDAAAAKAARELAAAQAEVNAGLREERAERERLATAAAALYGEVLDANKDTLTAEEALQREYEARVEKIRELGVASGEWGLQNVALQEAELRLGRDLAALAEERRRTAAEAHLDALDQLQSIQAEQLAVRESFYDWADGLSALDEGWAALAFEEKLTGIADVLGTLSSSLGDLFGARVDSLQAEIEKTRARADATTAAWEEAQKEQVEQQLEAGQLTEDQAKAREAAIEAEAAARRQATERQLRDEKRALETAWNRQQAMARAAAAVDAIRAGVALIPAFAFLGPGAPAAAAAVAALGLTTALAQIEATQPPELPTGRTPDHTVPIRDGVTRDDEATLNSRATAEVLRRLNATGGTGGDERPIEISLHLDRRAFGRAVLTALGGDVQLRPTFGGLGAGRKGRGGR